MLDAGFWILDPGNLILDSGSDQWYLKAVLIIRLNPVSSIQHPVSLLYSPEFFIISNDKACYFIVT